MKVLLILCLGVTTFFGAIDQPVRVDSGLVSGVRGEDTSVRVFKGIPFAAPPIGPLRWRAPQPAAKWDGVRKADEFSASCPQPVRTGTSTLLPTSYRLGPANEDCLYLNIWTTAKLSTDRLPIILYLPGGGFTTGSGSALVFDGEALAKKGVVVVTINYRLGALGFFSHPDLTKESDQSASGNYGLLDQVAALQWVQRNIAGFGGNSNRVTVFGQSAGAISVFDLIASSLCKGLFQKAIADSGGPYAVPIHSLPDAEQAGLRIAQALGAKTIAELRAKPFESFLSVTGEVFGPSIDGWFLRKDPITIFREGKQNNVPLLTGSNADEGNTLARPVSAQKYIDQSKLRFGRMFDSYIKLYPADSEEQARSSQILATTDFMAWSVWTSANLQAMKGKSRAYLYYFTRQPPPDAPVKGAAHSGELYYVFRNENLYKQQWAEWDRKLEDMMSSYWVNFAKSGDPNGGNLPHWPSFSADKSDRVMIFGDKVEVGSSRLAKANRDWFDAYYATQVVK